MNHVKQRVGLIVCAVLSVSAFSLALLALLMTLFPNMNEHVITGHITVVDTTENPVVQIGPELSTDGTVRVRTKGGPWETVKLLPHRQP